jgi:glycosyltransferase involved in cell wall biosynthesis
MQGVKLSILICTIPERQPMFKELFAELTEQCKCCNSMVQIVWDDRPKGSVTIGQKRNDLLAQSLGDYIVYIDDDDTVHPNYISEILKAIEKQPDCIGFKIKCNMEGVIYNAASSMKYDWEENVDGFKYVRYIYHKTPVKREIALQTGFPDKSFGEDYQYSMRLKTLLTKEIFIDEFLYNYNYKYENPKTKYGS